MHILQSVLMSSIGSKGLLNHFINLVYAFRHSTMRLIPLKLRAVYTLEEISVCSRCQILMRHHMENC